MSDTFCIMPFINMYLERDGDYVACGHSYTPNTVNSNVNQVPAEQAFNDEYYRKLRLDLINGVKNDNCMTCWNKEHLNIPSARQQLNESSKHLSIDYDELKRIVKENNGYVTTMPKMVGLKSDNLCNLKCITCNHYQSSQHEREVNTMREQNIIVPKWLTKIEELNKGNFYANDYIIENLDILLKNKVHMEIQGGEPLISPITHKILDYCIDNNYTDLNIQITINLSSLTDKVLDKIRQFPNIDLWISWDHISNEEFRYIRYPADYPTFLKNLNKLSKHVDSLGISFTASIFNCHNMTDIFTEYERLGKVLGITWKGIMFRNMQQPDYFSIKYMSKENKDKLIKDITEYLNSDSIFLLPNTVFYNDIHKFIDSIKDTPENYIEVNTEKLRVLELYDTLRNTDYRKLFPYV